MLDVENPRAIILLSHILWHCYLVSLHQFLTFHFPHVQTCPKFFFPTFILFVCFINLLALPDLTLSSITTHKANTHISAPSITNIKYQDRNRKFLQATREEKNKRTNKRKKASKQALTEPSSCYLSCTGGGIKTQTEKPQPPKP